MVFIDLDNLKLYSPHFRVHTAIGVLLEKQTEPLSEIDSMTHNSIELQTSKEIENKK